MIGGIGQYDWLGHVAASGDFRRILANGTSKEQTTIINSINAIAELLLPLDLKVLKKHLNKLTALGPTMKVWGRVLTIVRPDLFCTVSSFSVREKLSVLLEIEESQFKTVEGYLRLIQMIHKSPWFNTPSPKNKSDVEIWKRRVAFLDVVFYE